MGSKKNIHKDDIIMTEEVVYNAYDECTDYFEYDDTKTFNLEKYLKSIKVSVVNESEDGMSIEFDLTHIEASIANALRRILIAEVPTMAFEKIYLYQNTSVIQDEVLCHRLGLIPLKVDPRLFKFPLKSNKKDEGVDCEEEPKGDEKRNLIFNLNVSCTKNKNALPNATDPKQLYHYSSVYTNLFKWIPIGNQANEFSKNEPTIVHDNILVAKLRPGQEIEASCHAVKGIGRDHAKFSPVSTASYRLLPFIKLNAEISGEAAERLKNSFSEGVIDIVKKGAKKIAVVKDARRDTCSRNVFRHEDLAKVVQLGKNKQHFIFSVESTGALASNELVVEACKVMESKCKSLRKQIQMLV